MSVEQLVDEAWGTIADFINNNGVNLVGDNSNPKHYYLGPNPDDPVRLRVDYELEQESTKNNLGELIGLVAKPDLVDLIKNGDKDNTCDWLLHSMNGAKKRGKTPVAVRISETEIYKELKPKKNTVEYTLFLILDVEWES